MRAFGAIALALALFAAATPAVAFQSELATYQEALSKVCQTGVTPELVRLYQETVRAMDAAGSGSGRNSNFGSVRPPDFAYLDCFQKF
ncbi:MAG: hypothetical protein HY725_21855 [Candidatus Rokubacteria bacterium]|nr:hypothetical protein [Candidatus Rokubacteria bacterium]